MTDEKLRDDHLKNMETLRNIAGVLVMSVTLVLNPVITIRPSGFTKEDADKIRGISGD